MYQKDLINLHIYLKINIMENLKLIEIVQKGSKGKSCKAKFKCYCGNEFIASMYDVKFGHTKSCGCLVKNWAKKLGKNNLTHGDGTKNSKHYYIYNLWKDIKRRCFISKDKQYKNYGGRGITIFNEWVYDYIKFKEYILNNLGERNDGLTLDRIDNNGNYIPNNLRWASRKVQNLNKRKYTCKPRIRGCKLNEMIVGQIKKEIKEGIGGSILARKYNVTPMSITFIKQNKTWKHVT